MTHSTADLVGSGIVVALLILILVISRRIKTAPPDDIVQYKLWNKRYMIAAAVVAVITLGNHLYFHRM